MHAVASTNPTEREQLVLKHYPMARAIACRIYQRLPKTIDLDDLISAGVTGLLEAIDRYDPERAVPFETYAKHRIHGAVVDTLRSSDWVPRSVRRKVDLINISRNKLKEDLGRLPTRQEMADRLEINTKKYDALVADAQIRTLLSLDAPVGEENPTPMVEQIAGDDDVQGYWLNEEMKEEVLKAMQNLPEREKTALALYYLHDLSLKEAGKVLGVTESRACQLCSQGIQRLRRRLRHLIG